MILEASVISGLKKALDDLKVEYSSILLFGSRSKNDFKKESDWDFLIIIKKKMTLKDQRSLRYEIFRRFHNYFPLVSVDLILKDERTFENEKKIVNTISNEASLEGIEV